jgi:hypothetical protein
MKTKKSQVRVSSVSVLGVVVDNVLFDRSANRYYASISHNLAALMIRRAINMLSLWSWESQVQIEVLGSSFGDDHSLRLYTYRNIDNEVVQYSISVLIMNGGEAQLVVTGGSTPKQTFKLQQLLSDDKSLDLFNFSESDRKQLLKLETVEKLASRGLFVKQGDFLHVNKQRDAISETTI